MAVSAGPKLSTSLLFWFRPKESCCEQGVCGECGLLGSGGSKGHGERPCLCPGPASLRVQLCSPWLATAMGRWATGEQSILALALNL